MLSSCAGRAGDPTSKLGSHIDVVIPLAGLADLERSDRAIEPNALERDAEIGPPPGIDLEVLIFAREMFVNPQFNLPSTLAASALAFIFVFSFSIAVALVLVSPSLPHFV